MSISELTNTVLKSVCKPQASITFKLFVKVYDRTNLCNFCHSTINITLYVRKQNNDVYQTETMGRHNTTIALPSRKTSEEKIIQILIFVYENSSKTWRGSYNRSHGLWLKLFKLVNNTLRIEMSILYGLLNNLFSV